MATQVVMPKLSPTMEEGQLARWLKNEGDKVSVGEPIAEIDTDKATMEAQALATGVLRKIIAQPGETIPLGAVIAIIGEPGEDISDLLAKVGSGAAGAENKGSMERVEAGQYGAQQELAGVVAEGGRTQATIQGEPLRGEAGGGPAPQGQERTAPETAARPQAPPAGPQSASGNGQRDGGRLIVSPIAARMAAEANINLRDLTGSGPGGRIIKRDIEAAISSARQRAPAAPAQAPLPPAVETRAPQTPPQPAQQPQIEGASPYREEHVSAMRATIARRLTSSLGPVPHFFLTVEIEMDRAAEFRRSLNELDTGAKVSVNDIIIKVAAAALLKHPQVNASFQDKAVRYYERADIGVAVAVEEGLITPVVRAADRKSIGQISREVRALAERARARRLQPEEYTGATFSISNLGMFGIEEFTAIINPPEACILAVGAMQPKAVVREGEVVVRQIMRVTMSCDHRLVDGATGAKFLQTFKQMMENPLLLML